MEEYIEKNKKICIVVVAKENNIESLEMTINNLVENGCEKDEYIVALKKGEMIETSEFCEQFGIDSYEYENLCEVYYELPKNLDVDYISFINEGDQYTKNFKNKLLKKLNKDEYKSLYIMLMKIKKEKYILNENIKKNKSVFIEQHPEKIWMNIESAFINKELLLEIDKDFDYAENLKYYIDKNLLLKLMVKSGTYKVIKNIMLIPAKKLETSKESKLENYDLLWYKNLYNNINNLTEFSKNNYGDIIRFLQYSYMYMIKNVIIDNVNTKNKHIIVGDLKEEFYDRLSQVLQDVEDDIIMKTYGNKRVNYSLIQLKHKESNYEYRVYDNEICIINNNKLIYNAKKEKVKILLMEYDKGVLKITARYDIPYDEEKLDIFVKYNNKIINATKNYMYSEYKVFGEKVYDNYVFDLEIPLKISELKNYIEFFVRYNGTIVKLDINFLTPLSRLSKHKNMYWDCKEYTLNYRKNSILVMKNNKLRHIKREIKYTISLIRSKKKKARSAGRLRLLYHLTKPFYNKEIWLFEDKIFKGGDNGEYLYTYATAQKDGINKYYILDKNSIDAKRFKKENKRFVNYGSLRHKLLFLNSDMVFETHNSATKHHGFNENIEKYFRDLYNSKNVCIQHGLSVQYIPHLVNRINDNMKLYFLASPIEKKNLENKEYSYDGYNDILKITGCPRYDGLKNNDKKQILITPTWRNYLAMPAVKIEKSRGHNSDFKESEYFKIYNSIINNTKLINTAKECGYKIIYLLHPCTSPQIDDFDKNDDVELIAATDDLNYEKILTESSLMVTDYSGVQFDFAYMYKPIVYFHPEELPPSYEEGEYKYETMSLGEIVKKSDELIDTLCNYMKNDCKIKPEYEKRIDNFFEYHDYNNCKRIYDEIMKYRNGENYG